MCVCVCVCVCMCVCVCSVFEGPEQVPRLPPAPQNTATPPQPVKTSPVIVHNGTIHMPLTSISIVYSATLCILL